MISMKKILVTGGADYGVVDNLCDASWEGLMWAFESSFELSWKLIKNYLEFSRDIATYDADPSFALEKLGWRAECELDEMCADTWRWQSANSDGYSRCQ